MKPLYDNLWISTPEFPAEDAVDDLMMHGFMLRYPRGNLLIGRVEHPLDHEVLADESGVIRHYLTRCPARAIQQRALLTHPLAGSGQPRAGAGRYFYSAGNPIRRLPPAVDAKQYAGQQQLSLPFAAGTHLPVRRQYPDARPSSLDHRAGVGEQSARAAAVAGVLPQAASRRGAAEHHVWTSLLGRGHAAKLAGDD